MKFQSMNPVFPDQPMWGCAISPFTFIITKDGQGFSASVKIGGSTPFDGTRRDLGGPAEHKTLGEAEAACRLFYKKRDA